MANIICTLFEGNYHYGLAALINSLHSQGYQGSIYAGYLGQLPKWAKMAGNNLSLNWKGGRTLSLSENLKIHFLPLTTTYHLTNYKPDFMLEILNKNLVDGASKVFYFDPDIVLVSSWNFFEGWLDACDVALFEDVNSPLGENHPRRLAWRRYFAFQGITLRFKDSTYANAGFVGVTIEKRDFLETWKMLQEMMAPAIGGLERSSVSGVPIQQEANTPYAPFMKSDQDALNAAVEAWNGVFSFIGKEGMALTPGEAIIPHALGQPKPWQIKPVLHALAGFPPRLVDKFYWKYSNGIVSAHPPKNVSYHLFSQKIASFIGRFYSRS